MGITMCRKFAYYSGQTFQYLVWAMGKMVAEEICCKVLTMTQTNLELNIDKQHHSSFEISFGKKEKNKLTLL